MSIPRINADVAGSAPAQNHAHGAGEKSSARRRSAGITDESDYAKARVFCKLHHLALMVEFIEMVALSRFNCCTEKYQTVFGKKAGDGLEERLWILQMLCQHRSNNSLVLSFCISLFYGKSVFYLELNPAGMS
jgi:hypothetical protein